MRLISRRRLLRLIAVSFVLGVVFLASACRNVAMKGESPSADAENADDQTAILDEDESLDENAPGDEQDESDPLNTPDITAVETNATIVHVVDGDTFDAELDGVGKVRIRMLGVNTPETVDPRKTVECFGKDASDYTKSVLGGESRVRLDADAEADERDKYGRLLRNVVLADGTDLNAKLVADGYAYAYTSFPLAPERKVELTRLQQEAKEAKRGLWGTLCTK